MNVKRGIDKDTGFAFIEFRPQTQDEETWVHSMRPTPSQRIEFYEPKGEPMWRGLRIVNDVGVPKSARPIVKDTEPPEKPEPERENYAAMSEADLLTAAAEKGIPTGKAKRRGDLIKLMQDSETK